MAANTGSNNDYYFSTRFTGRGIFIKGDVNVLGLRLADTTTNESASLSVNSQFPASSGWRINPRLRLDYRKYKDSDDTQNIIGPGLRIDYQWSRRYYFEFDSGIEWTQRKTWLLTRKYKNYYINLGYRMNF